MTTILHISMQIVLSALGKKTKVPSREFYQTLGVCFNAVFLEIFGYIGLYTYIHTDRHICRNLIL